ncbi:hypothetical protein V8D89_015930, partial [Ganoderma adspersum]
LMATCRTLRYHALTTFQPHARERVLSLEWAVPLETEYLSYVRKVYPDPDVGDSQQEVAIEAGSQPLNQSSPPSPTDGTSPGGAGGLEARLNAMSLASSSPNRPSRTALLSQLEMAHGTHSPIYADWLHYLSQVHRTPAMRARRWVWALAEEVARVYHRKRAEGPFADLEPDDDSGAGMGMTEEQRERWGKLPKKSDAWNAYAQSMMQQLVMRQLVQGAGAGNGRGPRFTW